MARFDGSLARTLDFGDSAARLPAARGSRARVSRSMLEPNPMRAAASRFRGQPDRRPALPSGSTFFVDPDVAAGALRLPDKYRALEHRRRQAQMKARRLLAALD